MFSKLFGDDSNSHRSEHFHCFSLSILWCIWIFCPIKSIWQGQGTDLYGMNSLYHSTSQTGKLPVNRIWSRVLRRSYLSTALFPILNPSPYAVDESDSIWCLKKSPSFFSKSDRLPFLDDAELEEDEEEDVDDEATSLLDVEYISASSHIWANTWQIPSSTSGLRFG